MKGDFLDLFYDILDLSSRQQSAIKENRIEDAVEFCKRRGELIKKIKDIEDDLLEPGSDESSLIISTIKKILLIDKENSKNIKKNLNAIKTEILTIVKLKKSLCPSSLIYQLGRLNVNA